MTVSVPPWAFVLLLITTAAIAILLMRILWEMRKFRFAYETSDSKSPNNSSTKNTGIDSLEQMIAQNRQIGSPENAQVLGEYFLSELLVARRLEEIQLVFQEGGEEEFLSYLRSQQEFLDTGREQSIKDFYKMLGKWKPNWKDLWKKLLEKINSLVSSKLGGGD